MNSTCSLLNGCNTGFGLIGSGAPRTCQLTGQTMVTTTGGTTPLAAFNGLAFRCVQCPDFAPAATSTSPCRCKAGFWSEEDIITDNKTQFCTECPNANRCQGGNICTGNFGGKACAACKKGYYTLVADCFPCPETPGLEYIAVATVGTTAVYW